MPRRHIFTMAFAKVYPMHLQKAERKGRTKDEVDQIIGWLTGYDKSWLDRQIEQGVDVQTFFDQAPTIHPNSSRIKGVVCGIRVEEIDDPKFISLLDAAAQVGGSATLKKSSALCGVSVGFPVIAMTEIDRLSRKFKELQAFSCNVSRQIIRDGSRLDSRGDTGWSLRDTAFSY